MYLQDARYGYLRWGADGKVRQLDALNPQLEGEKPAPAPTSTIGAPAEQLDIGAVIKASQAVSGEILLDRLIETLMRIALEHAGAQRGLLILMRRETPQIEAEATTEQKMVVVTVRQEVVTQALLPESLLHTVIRTRQSVILDDAAVQGPFSADEYIREKRARSILCIPLVKQTQLLGVLYLENNLASHVFTAARISLVELLASQAAISLENAHLYGELMASEERWRKLFESVPVGVNLVGSHRRYVAANPAFQRMTGYSEAELRGLSPLDITHEDDLAAAKAIIAAQEAGQPYLRHREKRYLRKDGEVVWTEVEAFLVPVAGSAPFLAGVAVDVTERKRAEAELRESAQRYREVETALAHANRVATMGQLTASIAHEVSQPIHAVAINAQAASLWLAAQPPDLEEVEKILARIVENSNRAGDVIEPDPRPRQESPAAEGPVGDQRGDPRGDRTHPRRSGEERRFGADAARRRLAAHSRRQGSTAASDAQLDRQRRAGDERRQRRGARIADQHQDGRVGRRARHGTGFRSGAAAIEPRAPVRCLLHDKS